MTQLLRHGAAEFVQQALGVREAKEFASALEFAAVRVAEKRAQGYKFRSDGFFTGEPGNRSFADELIEGVLTASQREYKEKERPFFGNLLANTAFDTELKRPYANLQVRTGEQLSYTQLCLLRLFVRKNRFNLEEADYREYGDPFDAELIAKLQEVYDLDSRALMSAGDALFGLTDVKPGAMDVQGAGAKLHNLMKLWRIKDEELLPLALAPA